MISSTIVKTEILGLQLSNATKHEISEYIIKVVKSSHKKLSIFTPNPEMVAFCSSHPKTKEMLNKADIAICDGVGLYIAGQILKKPLKERITGIDLMDNLCKLSCENGLSIGLLGGKGLVAERTAECLHKKYPKLNICLTASEWDSGSLFKGGVDILFVAYGFPKQEEWIATNLPSLPIKAAMGVGGAFDFLSGEVRRAPFFMRAIGMEWLFRLIRQPWRIKRQLRLLVFIWLLIKELKIVR